MTKVTTNELSGEFAARPRTCLLEANQDGVTGAAHGLNAVLIELGVEPTLTVNEAAAILRWSYWKARRYFGQVEGICVSYRPKRYKRPYRSFTIPVTVFAREWQKMTGREPEASDTIRRRLVTIA
jgi:hypothetical protein